jgi:hypothetical protein
MYYLNPIGRAQKSHAWSVAPNLLSPGLKHLISGQRGEPAQLSGPRPDRWQRTLASASVANRQQPIVDAVKHGRPS